MSNQTTDPVELLRAIYPNLANGQQATIKQAVDLIKEMQSRLTDLETSIQRQPLPEAPTSATVKAVDPATQMEWLLTFRYHDEDKLIEAVRRVSGKLSTLGVIGFDAYVDSRRAERAETKALPAQAQVQPKSPAPVDALTFKAETLEITIKGDKTYYKVKGGKFAKFGVTIWPEVLQAAGFDLDTLAGITNLTGYTAHYVLNEKGDPNKVIGLEQA